MRDYVLGRPAVDGTGTTFSGGGRVVKNAARYNMCRLMAGSLGTLGGFTQVTLLVRAGGETSGGPGGGRVRRTVVRRLRGLEAGSRRDGGRTSGGVERGGRDHAGIAL